MAAAALLSAFLCLAPAAPPQDARPDDAAIRAAWSRLTPAERTDVAARVSGECYGLQTLQMGLLRKALELLEADANLLPEARAVVHFDPKVHAPAQPIPRKPLSLSSPQAQQQIEAFLGTAAKDLTPRPWVYDWGTGVIGRASDGEDPTHVFESALRGLPPQALLAEAVILRALDDGAERKALAAFAHAYTDREGNVYPQLTLYDAWMSGKPMEMPDVDVLGVLHDVLGDWKRWKAPVPAQQQKPLYDRVSQIFQPARRHRSLREALALTYLRPSAALPAGYDLHIERLHGLWEHHGGSAAAVAKVLPDVKKSQAFLGDWSLRYEKDAKLIERARARRARLGEGAELVRGLLVQALRDHGAFERTAAPPAEPPPKPSGGR